jgi:hypothetical protein
MAKRGLLETKNLQSPEPIVRKFRKMHHAEVRLSAGAAVPVAVCSVVDLALHHPCVTLTGKSAQAFMRTWWHWVNIGANRLWRVCAEPSNPTRRSGIIRANCDRGVEGPQWTVSNKTNHPADTKMCQLAEAPYLVVFYICDVLAKPL